MNDLNEALMNIARSLNAPRRQLDEVIYESFDFYDHMTDEPTYASRNWQTRNKLLAAYIREAPGDVGEIIANMTLDAENWAAAFEPGTELAFAIIKVAAEKAFEDAIDARIQDMFDDYCQSNGVFTSNGPDEPSELVGFEMNPDPGEEERQKEADNNTLLKHQAD